MSIANKNHFQTPKVVLEWLQFGTFLHLLIKIAATTGISMLLRGEWWPGLLQTAFGVGAAVWTFTAFRSWKRAAQKLLRGGV